MTEESGIRREHAIGCVAAENLSRLVVHHEIIGEAAAHLSELLNDLAFDFDGRYFAPISGCCDEHREIERSCHDRQLDLFDADNETY